MPLVDEDDADTTAAPRAPVVANAAIRGVGEEPHGADADDSTIQELPGAPPARTPASTRTPVAGPGTAGASPRPGARRPMMTLLGTGPARGGDDDEEHESVTGQPRLALPVRAPSKGGDGPMSAVASTQPSPVRDDDDENLDETEVQTLVATAARRSSPSTPSPADGEQDSVTTRGPPKRAPTPRAPVVVPSASSRKLPLPARSAAPTLLDPRYEPETPIYTERPTSPGTKAPVRGRLPSSPRVPEPAVDDGVEPYDDESVTSRAPALPDDGVGVTTRAPSIETPRARLGTTGPSRQATEPPDDDDDDDDSVTAQAPGVLTNMLRVIASDAALPAAPDAGAEDAAIDDEPPENRTAVMPGRPYGVSSASVAVAAPASPGRAPIPTPGTPYFPTERVSESALRVGGPLAPPAERASVGVIALADPRALAPTAFDPRLAEPPLPPRAPRYGAIVTLAGLVSVLVPVAVFFLLRGRGEVSSTQEPTVRVSDLVKLVDVPRGKAPPRTASSGPKRR